MFTPLEHTLDWLSVLHLTAELCQQQKITSWKGLAIRVICHPLLVCRIILYKILH